MGSRKISHNRTLPTFFPYKIPVKHAENFIGIDVTSINTPQYFTTVFRRVTGMTPSEYVDSVRFNLGYNI